MYMYNVDWAYILLVSAMMQWGQTSEVLCEVEMFVSVHNNVIV